MPQERNFESRVRDRMGAGSDWNCRPSARDGKGLQAIVILDKQIVRGSGFRGVRGTGITLET